MVFLTPCFPDTSTSSKRSKKKKSVALEDGIDQQWAKLVEKGANGKSMSTSPSDDNDAMFQYGGLVADGETDVVEAKAVQSDQKSSKAVAPAGAAYVKLFFFSPYYLTNSNSQSMIKIEKNPEFRSSMTAARNGDKKWKHSHLPDQAQTESLFKNVVVSRARMKTASLEPWTLLSVKDLKLIVDEVFPKKNYTVAANNVWYMLVSHSRANSNRVFNQ